MVARAKSAGTDVDLAGSQAAIIWLVKELAVVAARQKSRVAVSVRQSIVNR
jgi:hypothetical protein